jgi:chromosomal replication initiator protein
LSAPAVKIRDAVPPTVDDITADILEKSWADRQKAGWFSIVSETSGPKIEDIIRAVCKHYGVAKIDLLSARRTMNVVRPRQVGYYLSKTLTKHSLPEIGRRFGGKDHTSILAGVRRITCLRTTDAQIDSDVREIASALGGFIV